MTARKPALQLVREGNPGHRTEEWLRGGVKLPPAAPAEPAWERTFPAVRRDRVLLEVNRRCRATAREEWRRVVPVLDAMGLLASVDRQVLLEWCVVVARIEQCERALSVQGLVIEDERGTARRNGAAIIAQGYRAQMRKLMVELGLTPLARDTMRGDPGGAGADQDEGSPFDV